MDPGRTARLVAVLMLLVLGGCAEQSATTQSAPSSASSPAASPAERVEPPATPAPSSVAATPAPPSAAPAPPPPPVAAPDLSPPKAERFAEQPALKDVLFDPGRTDLGRHGTEIMKANARWLLENPGFLVLIEGHSDFKGSRDSNLAVGQRRARAAMDFLLKAGVPETRIQTVSHGSDRPVCPEKTEACAAKNRRVHFLAKPQ